MDRDTQSIGSTAGTIEEERTGRIAYGFELLGRWERLTGGKAVAHA